MRSICDQLINPTHAPNFAHFSITHLFSDDKSLESLIIRSPDTDPITAEIQIEPHNIAVSAIRLRLCGILKWVCFAIFHSLIFYRKRDKEKKPTFKSEANNCQVLEYSAERNPLKCMQRKFLA